MSNLIFGGIQKDCVSHTMKNRKSRWNLVMDIIRSKSFFIVETASELVYHPNGGVNQEESDKNFKMLIEKMLIEWIYKRFVGMLHISSQPTFFLHKLALLRLLYLSVDSFRNRMHLQFIESIHLMGIDARFRFILGMEKQDFGPKFSELENEKFYFLWKHHKTALYVVFNRFIW